MLAVERPVTGRRILLLVVAGLLTGIGPACDRDPARGALRPHRGQDPRHDRPPRRLRHRRAAGGDAARPGALPTTGARLGDAGRGSGAVLALTSGSRHPGSRRTGQDGRIGDRVRRHVRAGVAADVPAAGPGIHLPSVGSSSPRAEPEPSSPGQRHCHVLGEPERGLLPAALRRTRNPRPPARGAPADPRPRPPGRPRPPPAHRPRLRRRR